MMDQWGPGTDKADRFVVTSTHSWEGIPRPGGHTAGALGTSVNSGGGEADVTVTRGWGGPGFPRGMSVVCLDNSSGWKGTGLATQREAGAVPGPRGSPCRSRVGGGPGAALLEASDFSCMSQQHRIPILSLRT